MTARAQRLTRRVPVPRLSPENRGSPLAAVLSLKLAIKQCAFGRVFGCGSGFCWRS
jgi:hypothetical protein